MVSSRFFLACHVGKAPRLDVCCQQRSDLLVFFPLWSLVPEQKMPRSRDATTASATQPSCGKGRGVAPNVYQESAWTQTRPKVVKPLLDVVRGTSSRQRNFVAFLRLVVCVPYQLFSSQKRKKKENTGIDFLFGYSLQCCKTI